MGWLGCEHNTRLADPGDPTASDSPHQRRETPAGTPGAQVMRKPEITPRALDVGHTGDCWPQTDGADSCSLNNPVLVVVLPCGAP